VFSNCARETRHHDHVLTLHWCRHYEVKVLGWVTVSGSIPGAGHLFQYVTNQPPKVNSAFHPSGVGKWVPASAGKEKAGMVHSVSGWTRGVQVKLAVRSLENACHTWAP